MDSPSTYGADASPRRRGRCTEAAGLESKNESLELDGDYPYTSDGSSDRIFPTPLKPAARQSTFKKHALPETAPDMSSDRSCPANDQPLSPYSQAMPEILTARAVIVPRRSFSPTFGEWKVGGGYADVKVEGQTRERRSLPVSNLSGLKEPWQANVDARVVEENARRPNCSVRDKEQCSKCGGNVSLT